MNIISKEQRPGTLIVFEGQDGSGKSTQISILHKLLEANGFYVVKSKWNSDPSIKKLTKSLKKNDPKIPAPVFDMVHAADLMNRYKKDILSGLEAGMIVLCDRYYYTSLARGYARLLDMDLLTSMYEEFFVEPDLTIHLRVKPEISLERGAHASDLSHYEAGMDMSIDDNILTSFLEFQRKIDEGYLDLSKKYNFHTLDGSRPVYETTPEIRKIVLEYLEGKYNVELV